MIARAYDGGTLVFDRDAIVRAALHAHVEGSPIYVDPLERLAVTASAVPFWKGDVQRGAFHNGNGCGDYEVVAWTASRGPGYRSNATPDSRCRFDLPRFDAPAIVSGHRTAHVNSLRQRRAEHCGQALGHVPCAP